MHLWWALWKKEYRLNRTLILGEFILLFLLELYGVYLTYRYNIHVFIAPLIMIMGLHVFYPVFYLLHSLSKEWKQFIHLWLHCPQPAWLLLLSKFASGIFYTLVSFILSFLFLLSMSSNLNLPQNINGIPVSDLIQSITAISFYLLLGGIAISIYFSAWAMFISVVNASLKNQLGRFRRLGGFFTLILAIWGMGWLQETTFYQFITHWGAFKLPLAYSAPLYSLRNFFENLPLYAGSIVFYFILTLALFTCSAWLMDHKVEV